MRARARMASGIIPAYAGSTAAPVDVERAIRDHPRIRGEHPSMGQHARTCNGSSPHTRGARRRLSGRRRGPVDHPRIRGEHLPDLPHLRPEPWIIPAYAGSTTRGLRRAGMRTDHPRIRGEHIKSGFSMVKDGGSSPHTRGARFPFQFREPFSRIIPAYAGSTRPCTSTRPSRADHPRIRGEHISALISRLDRLGSSPHTRGALKGGWRRPEGARIIPAYAGSTRRLSVSRALLRDHPRIRGEHIAAAILSEARAGSSPHTRGAREWSPQIGRRARIIPAYAGSTSGARPWPFCRSDHPRIRGEHRWV